MTKRKWQCVSCERVVATARFVVMCEECMAPGPDLAPRVEQLCADIEALAEPSEARAYALVAAELLKRLAQQAAPSWLDETRRNLLTQDNRATADPVFVVQQRVRDYGYDPYWVDDVTWIVEGDDVDEEEAARLEAIYDETGNDKVGEASRTAYRDRWEFVTACFTEVGCEEYLAANGHNLCEPRIYVDTARRNWEWQRIRAWLCGQDETAAPAGELRDHYLLDSRSVVGNCALWWCVNGQGYACELGRAGLYTKAEAESHRETDIPVPRELAERLTVRHVRLDHLRRNMHLDKATQR